MTQSTYAEQVLAFAGLTGGNHNEVRSMANGEVSLSIPFGVAVAFHATDVKKAILQAGGAAKQCGVVMHENSYVKPNELDTVGLKPTVTMNVATTGLIWMVCEATASAVPGAGVFTRHTANGTKNILGAARHDVDTAGAIAMPGAVFTGNVVPSGLLNGTVLAGAGLAEVLLNAY